MKRATRTSPAPSRARGIPAVPGIAFVPGISAAPVRAFLLARVAGRANALARATLFSLAPAAALVFAAFLAACSRDKAPTPAAPREVQVAIRALSDDEITSFTASAQIAADPVEEGIRALKTGGVLAYQSQLEIEKRFAEINPRLAALLRDSSLADKAKIPVARILWENGETFGRDFLFSQLEPLNLETASPVLGAIQRAYSSAPLAPRAPLVPPSEEQSAILVRLLESSKSPFWRVVLETCAVCCFDKAEPLLLDKFNNPASSDRELIARHLAGKSKSPDTLRRIGAYLLQPDPEPGYGRSLVFMGLEQAVKSGEPARADAAYQAMETFFREAPAAARHAQTAVRPFCSVARPSAVPILLDILNQKDDTWSRGLALRALARFDKDKAVAFALSFLGDISVDSAARETLFTALDDANREQILSGIYKYFDRPGDPHLDRFLVAILLDHGGEKGRRLIESRLDKTPSAYRMSALWRLRGFSAKAALKEFMDAGILPPADTASLITKARAKYGDDAEESETDTNTSTDTDTGSESETKNSEGRSLRDPASDFFLALLESGGIHMFDCETGEVPCRHDLLIRDLASITQGKLVPFAAREVYHGDENSDETGSYTVEFGVGRHWIQFAAEDLGDWYDIESVNVALDKAAEAESLKERFILLEDDGQSATYLFADPDVLAPLAKKYGLDLAPEPGEPVELGKDFEKSILERFEKERTKQDFLNFLRQ